MHPRGRGVVFGGLGGARLASAGGLSRGAAGAGDDRSARGAAGGDDSPRSCGRSAPDHPTVAIELGCIDTLELVATHHPTVAIDSSASSPTTPQPASSAPAPPLDIDPSSIDADVTLLRKAAEQLDANDPTAALATLERHARLHPTSALAPERVALRVRASCAIGAVDDARAIAARYVADHPGTRLAESLATPCDERGTSTR